MGHLIFLPTLSQLAKEAAKNIQLEREVRNPFKSLLVRAVETVYAFDEAIRIIDLNLPREEPFVEPVAKAGIGFGCTEAPRGALWHRYRIDEKDENSVALAEPFVEKEPCSLPLFPHNDTLLSNLR